MTNNETHNQNAIIRKELLKRAFIFFRNGICFSFSWLVLISMFYSNLIGSKSISCLFLLKTFIFCTSVSLLFAIIFAGLFIRRKTFIFKLTLFTIFFLPIEIGYFYWSKIFDERRSSSRWLIFIGLIIILYLICLCIDRLVFAKKASEYNLKLTEYKKQRSFEEDERNDIKN